MTGNPVVYLVNCYNEEECQVYPFIEVGCALDFVMNRLENITPKETVRLDAENNEFIVSANFWRLCTYRVDIFDGRTGLYLENLKSNIFISHPKYRKIIKND